MFDGHPIRTARIRNSCGVPSNVMGIVRPGRRASNGLTEGRTKAVDLLTREFNHDISVSMGL